MQRCVSPTISIQYLRLGAQWPQTRSHTANTHTHTLAERIFLAAINFCGSTCVNAITKFVDLFVERSFLPNLYSASTRRHSHTQTVIGITFLQQRPSHAFAAGIGIANLCESTIYFICHTHISRPITL